jgi:hypothetical protein
MTTTFLVRARARVLVPAEVPTLKDEHVHPCGTCLVDQPEITAEAARLSVCRSFDNYQLRKPGIVRREARSGAGAEVDLAGQAPKSLKSLEWWFLRINGLNGTVGMIRDRQGVPHAS